MRVAPNDILSSKSDKINQNDAVVFWDNNCLYFDLA